MIIICKIFKCNENIHFKYKDGGSRLGAEGVQELAEILLSCQVKYKHCIKIAVRMFKKVMKIGELLQQNDHFAF